VGFRWFVRQRARALGVRGWVRNLTDGGVEVEADGDTSALARLRHALNEGPPGARVTRLDDLPNGSAATGEEPLPDPFTVLR